jgi:flagellar protein FliO/FliZ
MKRLLLAGGTTAISFILLADAALAQAKKESEQPLDLPLEQVQEQASGGGSSSGGGLGRTIIGLLIVCAIIYGLYWVLKQVKKAREEQASGSGLHSLASLPLGPNRSLHMIRAGRDIVLVGVAEHGVQPIRSYTEQEAYDSGLISDDDDEPTDPGAGGLVPKAGFTKPTEALGTALTKLRERTVRK